MSTGTGVEHSTVWEKLESLGYWEVCAWWVSRLMMDEHKLKLKKYFLTVDERVFGQRL